MASAVLANHQNEPDWTQPNAGGGPKFMGKATFPKSTRNPSPNPNRLTNTKKRQFQPTVADEMDESPAVTQSAASDDASSINRRPVNDSSFGTFVNFNISSYSRNGLIELKNRFLAELEHTRQLRSRIESQDYVIRSSSGYVPVKKGGIPNKKVSGNKRPLPSNFSKELKRMNSETGNLMKTCGQILSKLMKHKHGYIFNSPVDAVAQGLHDYHEIIKNPMDLGTVKSNLGRNFYDSPEDFAADVRLTFSNAMMYNPPGHEVHVLADQLLVRFEELFRPVDQKLKEENSQVRVYEEEVQASSWDRFEPNRTKKEVRVDTTRKSEQARLPTAPANPSPPVMETQMQAQAPSPPRVQPQPVKSLKQPKPKAKDPNKREMSLEEKHKLGMALQTLPQEKMENVVHIIKKRNGHLTQEGDEIELDIEAVDTETLWELDRFVTNYKKMVSKMKRQALMGTMNNAAHVNEVNRGSPVAEKIEAGVEARKVKKGEAGEEDVDIGDEMPMSSFPPVEIEKDNGHASSSSSSSSGSSSDSSSASDSDSGSSSGSDTDADDARS